jgi:UV DNA damage endonuclease
MIRVGYACINSKLPGSNRTCRLRNATADTITALASANIAALENILEWNAAHGIELFRITSDVIPFGSHEINEVPWRRIFKAELKRLGAFIRQKRLRVSMHPGQFTVIKLSKQ